MDQTSNILIKNIIIYIINMSNSHIKVNVHYTDNTLSVFYFHA